MLRQWSNRIDDFAETCKQRVSRIESGSCHIIRTYTELAGKNSGLDPVRLGQAVEKDYH